MLIQTDCIPCILNMSLAALRNVVKGEDEEKEMMEEILRLPALKGEQWDITSAEVVEQVMEIIVDVTEKTDPFLEEKTVQNKKVLGMYSSLREMVRNSDDPLLTAVKLAILGNGVDAMVSERPSKAIEGMRMKLQETALRDEDYTQILKRLAKCRLLVYLADNSGEAVLDKLFLETLKTRFRMEVFYIVRSRPALNDVTKKEAGDIGMRAVAQVMENGIDGPLPGTLFHRCSPEVQSLIEKADLIISKGGGNFETFSNEMPAGKPVTFMVLSKCPVYRHHFGIPLGSPILANMGPLG